MFDIGSPNYFEPGNKNAFYQQAANYRATHTAEETANQFANNPFGVSFQELLSTVPAGGQQQAAASGGYGGGGGAVGPAMAHYNLADKLNALNTLYDQMYGGLQRQEIDNRDRLNKGFDTQSQNLQKQYETNQGVMPWQFVGRGTRYSSDYENAMQQAADVYKQNNDAIAQDKADKLAALGQAFAPKYAGIQAGKQGISAINPDFYGTQSDYNSMVGNLDNQINSASQSLAGIGTNQDFINQVNGIAPAPNQGADKLKSQLDQLSGASIPGFAKQTIAQGLIKQNGGDQSQYWTDYFQKANQGQSTSPLA